MKAVPRSRYLLFFGLVAVGCALDLASKQWMFAWLGMPRFGPCQHWLWDKVLGFQTSLNAGALFGMGQGKVVMFAAFSAAAVVGILWWLFAAGAARDAWLTAALGCVSAGILGNLYDRLGLPGLRWNDTTELHRAGDSVYAVRDWILVMFGQWPWPNFNLADSLLVCGAAMLLWHAFGKNPNQGNPKSEARNPKQSQNPKEQ